MSTATKKKSKSTKNPPDPSTRLREAREALEAAEKRLEEHREKISGLDRRDRELSEDIRATIVAGEDASELQEARRQVRQDLDDCTATLPDFEAAVETASQRREAAGLLRVLIMFESELDELVEASEKVDELIDGLADATEEMIRRNRLAWTGAKNFGMNFGQKMRDGAWIRWRILDKLAPLIGLDRPPAGARGHTVQEGHRRQVQALAVRIERMKQEAEDVFND